MLRLVGQLERGSGSDASWRQGEPVRRVLEEVGFGDVRVERREIRGEDMAAIVSHRPSRRRP